MSFENLFAKVIAAEGEHKASRALRMAAEVIMDSPAALQVGLYKELGLGGVGISDFFLNYLLPT